MIIGGTEESFEMNSKVTMPSYSYFSDDTVHLTGSGSASFGGGAVENEFNAVALSQVATTGGRKFDGGKLQYGLVPPNALKATVEVLTFGAEKYEPDNWKWVPDSKRRYFDAAQRHLWAWKSGEQNDQETGKNHLAHAMCCLMFLYEHDTIDFLNNGEANEVVK